MPESLLSVLMFLALFLLVLAGWTGVIVRLALGMRVFPPSTPRSVPWGAGSVILAVVGWLALQVMVPTVYLLVAYPRQPGQAMRPELSPGEQMTLSAVANALILVAIPLLLLITSGAGFRDLGISTRGFFQNVFRGMVAYTLLFPVVFGVMLVSTLIWDKTNHPLEDALKLGQNPSMIVILFFAAVVFAPLSEELIFRGILLGYLTRLIIGRAKPQQVDNSLAETGFPAFVDTHPFAADLDSDHFNPYASPLAKLETPIESEELATPTSKKVMLVVANVAVSLIFAALHAPVWPTPIPIFFLSLGLGFLYQRTGSLIPSMALHMTFNGVSTVLLILALSNPLVNPPAKPKEPPKIQAKPAAMIA